MLYVEQSSGAFAEVLAQRWKNFRRRGAVAVFSNRMRGPYEFGLRTPLLSDMVIGGVGAGNGEPAV